MPSASSEPRRPPRRAPGCGGEGGAVTAELAVGLVGVVIALSGVLSVAQLSLAHVAVTSGAAAGARAAARGDEAGAVSAAAVARAGPGASATVTGGPGGSGGIVVVAVARPVSLLLPGTPSVLVRESASAAVERADPDQVGVVDGDPP